MLVDNEAPKMSTYLPQALGATGLVVAGPVVAVWALRAWQVVGSTAVAISIGVVLSLAVSFAGSVYWANRESSRDVLFSELMIWGWLRRWRAEHQLTAALERLAQLTSASASREATPQLSMLKELAEALEAGDPYTRNHSRRVARYASMIAERLGLPADEVDRIRTAAAVHDVGKVRTPIEVLHNPGRLTDEEYTIIKAHPVDGARLVEALGDERLTAIVRHHHERLDGRGYPDGLRGEEIPLGARIVAVADTFDAITSARPYRPASPHRRALDILIKEAGTQLDVDAVRAFRACYAGRRPFALWMTLLAFPQRVSTSLGNGATASAVSITKVVAAASTVAVVGGAAASARPLMVVAAFPRATATAGATAEPPSSPAPAAAAHSRPVAAAVGAKLTAPTARTRERMLLRRPGTLSRRFPASPMGHRVARRSSHAGSPSVSAASPSVPVTAPSASATPGSTPTSADPVSTVAAAPTTTTTTTTTTPRGSGSGTATGTTETPTKGHGHGAGGVGQGKGHGHGTATPTTTTTPTPTITTTPTTTPAPTTTIPVADPPGNGNGNGNSNAAGNGNGNGNAGGNMNGNANGHNAAASAPSAG
jgi:putative nucleotidyltransferase with HDIG domain